MANVSSSNKLGENVPKLRFPGFSGEWEEKKFSDLANGFNYGMNVAACEFDGLNRYLRITDIDDNTHEYISSSPVSPDGETSEKYVVKKHDILFVRTGASTGKTYLYNQTDGLLYFAGFLVRANVNTFNDSYFVFNLTLTQEYKNWVRLTSMRSGQPGINALEYATYKAYVPEINEQHKIALFLKLLDKKMKLQRRLLETLKLYKRGLLLKLFPRSGEKEPELRFSSFTDNWEQHKLGEFGSVSMCKRIFKEQTTKEGDVPFYKIGTFGGVADAFISRELFDEYKSKYPYPEKGSILISASGSIGRTVEFMGKDEYFQDSNIVWLKHDQRLDDTFLKYIYEVTEWAGIEGSTIKRLYNDNILKTNIKLPSIKEQREIGEYFRCFDNIIDLNQEKCYSLEKIKSAFLQNLFI